MHSWQHEIMSGLLQTQVMQLQHKVPVSLALRRLLELWTQMQSVCKIWSEALAVQTGLFLNDFLFIFLMRSSFFNAVLKLFGSKPSDQSKSFEADFKKWGQIRIWSNAIHYGTEQHFSLLVSWFIWMLPIIPSCQTSHSSIELHCGIGWILLNRLNWLIEQA